MHGWNTGSGTIGYRGYCDGCSIDTTIGHYKSFTGSSTQYKWDYNWNHQYSNAGNYSKYTFRIAMLMLNNISSISKIYCITGKTDMCCSIMVWWQLYEIPTKWIHTQMHFICFVGNVAIHWMHFTSTVTDSASCIKDWTAMANFSGCKILLKLDRIQDKSSAGWWKAYLLSSQKQFSLQTEKSSGHIVLCNM